MAQNNKYQIAVRREQVSRLYLEGCPQFRIAEKLGVTQPQISYDLKKLRSQWVEDSKVNIGEIIAKELAKIDKLEFEYWEAWNKSKQDFEKKKRKYIDKQQKEQINEEVVLFGDPRFLQGIERCIERRCKLLGLDAPEKGAVEHTVSKETLEFLKQLNDRLG